MQQKEELSWRESRYKGDERYLIWWGGERRNSIQAVSPFLFVEVNNQSKLPAKFFEI
jgi:hypothetical protein